MKRNSVTSNKGYSFVETVIVIAIIIVLSAMALATVTIINSARTKDAAVSFGEEISTLKLKCMNMTPSSGYDTYAISLYKDSDGKFNCCLVEYNFTTSVINYISDENIKFTSSARVELDVGSSGSVYKNGTGYTSGTVSVGNQHGGEVLIWFNKNGTCKSGYSDSSGQGFVFYRGNDTNPTAKVLIKQNGGVVIK